MNQVVLVSSVEYDGEFVLHGLSSSEAARWVDGRVIPQNEPIHGMFRCAGCEAVGFIVADGEMYICGDELFCTLDCHLEKHLDEADVDIN